MNEHGYGPYSRGCRCIVCRQAKADYVRGRRQAGVEPQRSREFPRPAWNQRVAPGASRVGVSRVILPNLRTHGTPNGYRRGCRCWPCTDASAARDRARRAKRKATAAA